ncbi:MAG TPA: M56 family metallopeptidase, partial [Verrucomicrobiae bacterium]
MNLAWPMVWQSSLLIAVVCALDILLARKVRAAVRYALWLVVLVKLLLPPTLALPSGVMWWLARAQPAVPAPVARHFTVTYDQLPLLMEPNAPAPVPVVPPPALQLKGAGWALILSTIVGAGLMLWVAFRWWQVGGIVRRASNAEGCSVALAEAMQLAGGKRKSRVRVKVTNDRMSPAVCGLVQPVILLPRALVQQLSAEQLRAVLLHELFHLRRGDVWLNCVQALLQIIYWWHPLLWMANARIRRLREDAVDDAVMLALNDSADCYAPTLLEVAKLVLRRPLLSLGLVGIMESRSALRQRIERLLDFHAPRRAGLTFVSLCGICVFSAAA